MRSILSGLALAGAAALAFPALADLPADAPAGSTGICKDGTYSSNATKSGACSGHKGVKEWYAAKAGGAAPAATAAATPTAAPAPAASPAPAPAPAAAPAAAAPAARTAAAAPAAGGGPGQVWVNSSSKVYHCPGTKYYGKTKAGSYMSEADAKTAGYHGDHGKTCS